MTFTKQTADGSGGPIYPWVQTVCATAPREVVAKGGSSLNRPDHIPEIITASLRYMCLRRGADHTLVYVQPQYNLQTTPSAALLPLKSFQPADNVFTRLQVSRPTWGEMLLGAVLLVTGVAAGGLMQQRARMGGLRAATVFAAALFHPVDAAQSCIDQSECDYADPIRLHMRNLRFSRRQPRLFLPIPSCE